MLTELWDSTIKLVAVHCQYWTNIRSTGQYCSASHSINPLQLQFLSSCPHFNPMTPASVAPPYGKDPPLALPPFFCLAFCPSVSCFVCSPSPPSFHLHTGMQTCRNLGLKMIDQTCQSWLLLLKMATLAMCLRLVRVWVTLCVIGHNKCVHSLCFLVKGSM